MELIKQCATGIGVCQSSRWASLLSGSAMMVFGLKRRSLGGYALAALGCDLVTRGVTGRSWMFGTLPRAVRSKPGASASLEYKGSIRVDQTITINKSPEILYAFWRNLENLPRFMDHIKSVERLDEQRSHWVVKGPAGFNVEWDAEIINDIPNQLIAWRSLPGADVDNSGSVHFEKVEGRGTTVKVVLRYDPPAGTLGGAFARWLGEDPSEQVLEDLRRFQQLVEHGAGPAAAGAPREGAAGGEDADAGRRPARVHSFTDGRRENVG